MRAPGLLDSLSARARADAFHHELEGISRILPPTPVGPRTLTVLQVASTLAAKRPAKDIEVETLGPISVRVHRPVSRDGGALPAMLWIHGGGYVIGTAAQDDAPCHYFAEELGIVVAAVDYCRRLGSASGLWICSTRRISPTRSD